MDEEYDNSIETAGAGTESLPDRLRSRSLGDIRIHDSEQAGELVRRLGARAFTIGRHVFVRPELAKPGTPKGEALLAHEAYHVAEQTGAISSGSLRMPLLRPPRPATSGSAGAGTGAQGSGGVAVQRLTSRSGAPSTAHARLA